MESRDQEQVHRFLGTVKISAESLLGILNDILDFSKIEASQLQIDNRHFNLPELLQKIVSIMSVPAAEKGLDLQVVIDPDLPVEFSGDDLRIYQILLNLVGNAIKFTFRGTVIIDVRPVSEQREDDMLALHFSVADTGIGIVAEKLRQIFNSFEQVDSSYTRQYGGTGLGLSICRQLTHLMGGGMWVDSVPDSGSTFHFILHLQPCSTAPSQSCSAAGGTSGIEVRNLRILVVDDNEVNRDLARMLLAGDHHVDTAGNGIEALQTLCRAEFDVIMMDVQMPLMDGLTTTAIIRDLEEGRPASEDLPEELVAELGAKLASGHIPIVAMTAHAMAGDREMRLDAGMDGYMTKPFQLAQLNQVFAALAAKDPAFGDGMSDGRTEGLAPCPVSEVDQEISPEQVAAFFRAGTNLTMEQSQRLLATVRMSITGNLAKAEEALRDRDYPALGVAAHTLKGTLLQCGINSLANLADDMYCGIRAGEQADCGRLLAALRNRLGGLLDEGGDGIQTR
jgi:CheY-like chemotaxis protein